jgi:hypothetical protein
MVCCVLVAVQANAQGYNDGDVHAAPAKKRTYTEREMQELKDGVISKNGRMFLVKNGAEESMYESAFMLDGTKVSPNGTYIRLDGTKDKLKDNQRMLLSGKLEFLPPVHFVTMKQGKMIVVNDSIEIFLDRELTLENGNHIYPDGHVMVDGKRVEFSDGDRMNMSGAWMEPVHYGSSSWETKAK